MVGKQMKEGALDRHLDDLARSDGVLMGRKPKVEKRTITVVVNGTVIPVILHPPKPPRRTWYAYWPGLTASKSTGQTDFEQAALAVEGMVRNGGKQGHVADTVLSDEEFVEIQRRHFGRKTERASKATVSEISVQLPGCCCRLSGDHRPEADFCSYTR